MDNFRYILDKTSKKYCCPACHQKTFVRFVDLETNELLRNEFGRCDREQKCSYFFTPMNNTKIETIFQTEPRKTVSYHDTNLVARSIANFKENNFVQFLQTLFTEDQVKSLINRYFIGSSTYWKGATVFWQIDNHKKTRHGKIMQYDKTTGKRLKNNEGKAYISSVRSELKLKDFNLKQCLFGLHLINENKAQRLAIVESEKTAILMSQFIPDFVWLATGSKNGFKYDYLKPLKNNEIIAFPDKSEYTDWLERANELNALGFKITVSQLLENNECKPGSDLADLFLNAKVLKVEPIKTPRDVETYSSEVFDFDEDNDKEKKIEVLKAKVLALESFFNSVNEFPESLRLDAGTIIRDCKKMINSHLRALKLSNGTDSYKPYLDRLELMEVILKKDLTGQG